MRSFATLFVGGTVAVFALKAFTSIFLPLAGALIGIVLTGLKLALFAGVIYLVYSLIFKRKKREVEVEVGEV